jgi:hypothetical protein
MHSNSWYRGISLRYAKMVRMALWLLRIRLQQPSAKDPYAGAASSAL